MKSGPGRSVVLVAALACVGAASVVSCVGPVLRGARVDPPVVADERPRDYPGLHNVVAYHDGFYSGSAPEGEAAFEALAGMGVRTIVTVDGAEPEVGKARARGMRYIHLPIGYNGFDEGRKLELVRAVRDARAQGPVYIHCHHGKHRAAGAAATVAVSLGWMTNEEATARMRVSGTAADYKGLYACTAAAGMLSAAVIDGVSPDFPEVSRPRGLVRSMVDIDAASEHLKAVEKAGWGSPAEHPDLVPAAEAGRLADLLRFLKTDERVLGKPEGFRRLLAENQERAAALEQMIVDKAPAARISDQFRLVSASCKDCHTRFRD